MANDKQVPDITGGKTAPILKPAPAHAGKRLSKRGKGILLVGGGSLALLAVIGVMEAGHHPSAADTDAGAPQVGVSHPPPPPPATLTQEGPDAAGQDNALHGAGQGTQATAALTSANLSKKLTPEQKYQQWLTDYHYKMLEARIEDHANALTSTLGVKTSGSETAFGAQSPNGLASPASSIDSNSYLQAALKAISQTGTVPPDLLAKLQGVAAGQGSAQSGNQGFLDAQKQAKDKNGYLNAQLTPPLARAEVTAGSIIPAVMVTGIDSDLPGEIVAQVRQNVYNSLNPSQVLIPQGTRIIGEYSSAVAYGQRRVLVAWNRLIFPNGETIALRGMPGTNGIGEAGFHDLVDNHYWRIFGSAVLISLIGAGAQLSQPQQSSAFTNPTAGQTAAAAIAQEMDSVGTNLLNKNLNIQPTLKIRPGYLFNVLVTRTMILPKYPEQVG